LGSEKRFSLSKAASIQAGAPQYQINISRNLKETILKSLIQPQYVLAVALAFTAEAKALKLLSNGSFESPAVDATARLLEINSGAAPLGFGWTVNSGTVELVLQGYVGGNGAFNGAPFDGQQWLDLDGISPGTISQEFGTTPGAQYSLHFAYANNPYPSFGHSEHAVVSLIDTGSSANLITPITLSHTTSTANDYAWSSSGDILFTAQGTMTRLTFASTDLSPNNAGIFLDNVAIVAVPEPGATLLTLGGLAVLSGWRRRAIASAPASNHNLTISERPAAG
jgi:hypothetical protein